MKGICSDMNPGRRSNACPPLLPLGTVRGRRVMKRKMLSKSVLVVGGATVVEDQSGDGSG